MKSSDVLIVFLFVITYSQFVSKTGHRSNNSYQKQWLKQ